MWLTVHDLSNGAVVEHWLFIICENFISDLFVADETILLDLKHLLMEAKQNVPDFLRILESENKKFEDHGCKWINFALYVLVLRIAIDLIFNPQKVKRMIGHLG